MDSSNATIIVAVIGAVVSFIVTRYWALQAATLKEAEKLAREHALLVQRVFDIERAISLHEQLIQLLSKAARD